MAAIRPADKAQLEEAVTAALANGETLEIISGGSKRALGRPPRADHLLDLGAFNGIVDYEPSELVLTARAATPMAVLTAQLDAEGQMLAFEPPDWRDLLGSQGEPTQGEPTRGEPTLGGTIACNLAGPRRVRAGAARDHFLGFSAVNGRGEGWKAGGRVVKNVTGYDMGKLQAGAYGTLSVLTEITVRVLPRPETTCSLVLPGLEDEAAVATLARALNAPHEVSAAAHLPASAASRSRVAAIAGGGAATVLRLEGPRPSVDYRAAALQALFGAGDRLNHRESSALWTEIGAVHGLLGDGARVVWRLCPTPSAAPALLRRVASRLASAEGFYDWGGGLLWLSLDGAEAGPDGGAAIVRAALGENGGHATLIRAPDAVRAVGPVFQPAQPALAALARRVKAGFDPRGILNPGRMQEGM